jgi:hypothetical protein
LLRLLQKYEALFDGTLVGNKWNTDPVNMKLCKNAKPASSRYYPVPKIIKETFRKELLCLGNIGVLTKSNSSIEGPHQLQTIVVSFSGEISSRTFHEYVVRVVPGLYKCIAKVY